MICTTDVRFNLPSIVALSAVTLALCACGQNEPSPVDRQRAITEATNAVPQDAKLAALYVQSCKACHTVENSGAPLARDTTQWEVRWQKGMPVLLQNVIAGFNGMPAGGQCFACTAQDYEALIRFLAGHDK